MFKHMEFKGGGSHYRPEKPWLEAALGSGKRELIFLVLMGTRTGKSLYRFHQSTDRDRLEGPLQEKNRTDGVGQAAWSSLNSGNSEQLVPSVPHSPHSLLGTGKYDGSLCRGQTF